METIVLPRLYCPFPSAINKHAESLHQHTIEWVRKFNLISNEAAYQKFCQSRFSDLATRVYPDAEFTELKLLSDWNVWTFIMDDQMDEGGIGKQAEQLAAFYARLVAVLKDLDDTAHLIEPLGIALNDIKQRIMQQEAGFIRLGRFIDSVEGCLTAFVWETKNRARGIIPVDIEYRIMQPGDEVRWIHNRRFPVHNPSGEVYRFVGIAEDITDRKIAETRLKDSLQEKELLLQEIHHRVKNNLQVISSLLDLQSQYIQEQAMQSTFRDCCNRVKSIALVHETLYQSKKFASINLRDYIQNLSGYLFQIYGVKENQIKLELDIDEVTLNIKTAIPCGLIINELVSNALKHAFPNSLDGTISVTFSSDLNNHYTLIVRDSGIGFTRNQGLTSIKTLGLQLVNVLSSQLEGILELDEKTGTEFSLIFSELIEVN